MKTKTSAIHRSSEAVVVGLDRATISSIATNKVFQFLTLVTVGAIVVGIALYALSIVWLIRLRRTCKCSDDAWRRTFIIAFPPVALVVQALFHHPIVTVAALGAWIGFTVITNQYLRELKREKCECATRGDLPLKVFQWFPIGMWSLYVALLILTVMKIHRKKKH